MAVDQWHRIQDLFVQALQVPADRRTAFLDEACPDDPATKAEVLSLLESDQAAPPDFMQPPPRPGHVSSICDRSDPLLGKHIGQYKIERVIGSGGMGTVYEATQAHPKRSVAVKVLHAWSAKGSILRRFEFESEILAHLTHRSIAQVFDASTHRDVTTGRRLPYFAMEFVPDAKSITAYAHDAGLDTADRLRLFCDVCDAVRFAHQKGVVHRDIKPANILVGADGQVKMIDFGVARATDSDVAITTMQTDVGQIVGTIQYMSPEQCAGNTTDIDFRTDVYSLGVVLYELLTGQLPYDATSSIIEAARVIRETSPKRLTRIKPKLRGDIETIVLKCLEKDPEQRYQSAAELAADVQRYLNDEPIQAAPHSLLYQFSKFARRNKALVAAGAAMLLTLVGAVVVSSAYAIKANHSARAERAQKQEAQQQRRRAENRTRDAQLQRRIAQRQAARAQEQEQLADFQSYAATLRAAQAAIEANDVGTARAFLESVDDDKRAWEWRHLYGRLDQSIETLSEAQARQATFAIDPPRHRLAIAWPRSGGSAVSLYDLTHEPLKRIQSHERESRVADVAFSADGSLLAERGGLTDQAGRVFEIRVRQVMPRQTSPWSARWGSRRAMGPLAFRPGSHWLAAQVDNAIELRDIASMVAQGYEGDGSKRPGAPPRCLARLEGHERPPVCLTFSRDGALLASGSDDKTIRLWDMDCAAGGGKDCEAAVLIGHSDHVGGIAFSPSGNCLASASVDETIRLWDVPASIRQADEDRRKGTPGASGGTRIGVLTGHTQSVLSVAYDATGTRLVSGGHDQLVRIWDVNEKALVCGYGAQRNWLVQKRELLESLRGHTAPINRVAFLPDGRVVSSSDDGSCKLWAPGTEDVPALPEHDTSLADVVFSPDGRFVISAGYRGDSSFIVWDVARGKPVARHYFTDLVGPQGLACFRSSGKTLLAVATGCVYRPKEGGQVELWDIADLSGPFRILAVNDWIQLYTSIAVSDDGTRLAAGTVGGTAFVWDISDLNSPRIIQTLEGHTDPINSVLFLDEPGRWLASAGGALWADRCADHTIRLWDIETAREVDRREDHATTVMALSLSPDRRTVASASLDKTVRLWSVAGLETGSPRLTPRRVLEGHTQGVHAVAFHPTEHRLFSGGADEVIKVWNPETGGEVLTLRGPAGYVMALATDPSGERLTSASSGFQGAGNCATLWETRASPSSRAQRALYKRARMEVKRVFRLWMPTPEAAREEARRALSVFPAEVREDVLAHLELYLPHPNFFDIRASAVASQHNLPAQRYRRALTWAEFALDLSPRHVRLHVTIGLLHYRLGHFEQALKLGQQVAESRGFYAPSGWDLIAMA
ncbi:MAG: protein kinase, partial [Phycisphaerae bacterium]